MRMKKIISAALSVAITLSLLVSNVFADDDNIFANENVTLCGKIKTDDYVNISNIKVDILKSDLMQTDEDVSVYENTYMYSVYTDSTGNYSFIKPSEKCLVQIDLSSLPLNTGVDSQSYFVDDSNNIDDFTLNTIADIDIVDAETANVYDAYGNDLVTNLNLETTMPNISMYGIDNNSEIQTNIMANANGFVKTKSIDVLSNTDDLITKADSLYTMGQSIV